MSVQPAAVRSLKRVAHGGGGREVAAVEHFHEHFGVGADDHEGGGFQGLHEAAGVADGDDVVHPLAAAGAGAEFHDAGGLGSLGIFAEEFGGGFVIRDGLGGINVAAVDVVLVLDLPCPACIHGLRGGVGQDGLVGAIPSADDGAVAKEGALEADKGFFERLAEQLAAEAAGVYKKVGFEFAPVFEMHGGDAVWRALGAGHFSIHDLHAHLAGDGFEGLDEFFVFDVKGVPALDVGAAVGLAGEGFALPHEGGGDAGVAEVLVAVVAVAGGEVAELLVELVVKRVIEPAARTPLEADAELPCGLGHGVEMFPVDAEILEEMFGEVWGGPLADADDAKLGAAHDADGELGEFAFQRECREEACAAGAEDEDVANHTVHSNLVGRRVVNGRVSGRAWDGAFELRHWCHKSRFTN